MDLTALPKGEPLACRFWMCWMKKPHFAQAAGLRCNGQQKLALRVKSADAANEDRARLCGSRKAITPTCPACQGLSPWESWREAPERARLPFQYSRFTGF